MQMRQRLPWPSRTQRTHTSDGDTAVRSERLKASSQPCKAPDDTGELLARHLRGLADKSTYPAAVTGRATVALKLPAAPMMACCANATWPAVTGTNDSSTTCGSEPSDQRVVLTPGGCT